MNNTWIKLSGSDLWHRVSRSPFEAALCGNPPTGIVLTRTTTETEPQGPKCPDCVSRSLDTEPYFSSEAQETFLFECRVYAVKPTICVKEDSEGIYLGRTRHGALVGWDTPSGEPYKESVPFECIRNLYR